MREWAKKQVTMEFIIDLALGIEVVMPVVCKPLGQRTVILMYINVEQKAPDFFTMAG